MEHLECWLRPTIIYFIALAIIIIIDYKLRKKMGLDMYLKGRIDTLKEYCDKMELIDRMYEQAKKDNNIIDIEVK